MLAPALAAELLDASQPPPPARVAILMAEACRANSVDTLSMLLALRASRPQPRELERHAERLIAAAMESDAADCVMLLLNQLEELRRHKEETSPEQAAFEEQRPLKRKERDAILDYRAKAQRIVADREELIAMRDTHCGEAPSTRRCLALARAALARCPPARRTARALLLQAHRMRRETPKVGEPLRDVEGKPLLDSAGEPSVPWPPLPEDLPPQLCGGGVGGYDLSLGGEAVPVQWVNEVGDGEQPPPIVFVSRSIDVDVLPDWTKRPNGCSETHQVGHGQPLLSNDRCGAAAFRGKPEGNLAECHWACRCPPTCARRALQRGAPHRLQVFKHEAKGWCLRTLTAIQRGAFIMEYAAERVSMQRGEERSRNLPDTEVYMMDLSLQAKDLRLDALSVRNHAAFAAFSCSKPLRNMEKKRVLTQHWDAKVPHVGFYATRDIQPMEELSYMRLDEMAGRNAVRNCYCGHQECCGRL